MVRRTVELPQAGPEIVPQHAFHNGRTELNTVCAQRTGSGVSLTLASTRLRRRLHTKHHLDRQLDTRHPEDHDRRAGDHVVNRSFSRQLRCVLRDGSSAAARCETRRRDVSRHAAQTHCPGRSGADALCGRRLAAAPTSPEGRGHWSAGGVIGTGVFQPMTAEGTKVTVALGRDGLGMGGRMS